MANQAQIQAKLIALKELAPAGYALALHVRFTASTFLIQTYSQAWRDYYTQKGLVMSDPIVRWGLESRGAMRWSDLADRDPSDVLSAAADHGLSHGVVSAVGPEGGGSIGGFARNDRPFSDNEIAALHRALIEMHALTDNLSELSPDTANELKKMSIEYTQPAAG